MQRCRIKTSDCLKVCLLASIMSAGVPTGMIALAQPVGLPPSPGEVGAIRRGPDGQIEPAPRETTRPTRHPAARREGQAPSNVEQPASTAPSPRVMAPAPHSPPIEAVPPADAQPSTGARPSRRRSLIES